jgi:5'-nucleotidase
VITPKDADGNKIKDVDDTIFDADSETAGVQELKLWEALVQYGQSMEDTDADGIGEIPEAYLKADGRIVGYE